jgi:hypothetical protein
VALARQQGVSIKKSIGRPMGTCRRRAVKAAPDPLSGLADSDVVAHVASGTCDSRGRCEPARKVATSTAYELVYLVWCENSAEPT